MGGYVVCGRGLDEYRIYRWQPCAVKDHGHPTTLLYIFLPVYWADIKWIHPQNVAQLVIGTLDFPVDGDGCFLIHKSDSCSFFYVLRLAHVHCQESLSTRALGISKVQSG